MNFDAFCMSFQIKMPYKCCVADCKSNYDSTEEKVATFAFPNEPDIRSRWTRFVNRKDWEPGNARICSKHFEPMYINVGAGPDGRTRLKKNLKPVPTILDPNKKLSPVVSHMKAPSSVPRRSPRKRIFQEDQFEEFSKTDTINSFDDLDASLAPLGYLTVKYTD